MKRKIFIVLTAVINGKPFALKNNILFPDLLLGNVQSFSAFPFTINCFPATFPQTNSLA
jgi:hypothetical protein